MENAKTEKEQKNQINIAMDHQIMSSINSFPYFPQNIQTIHDFQKLGILNSLQTVKTYSHPTQNIPDIVPQQPAYSPQETVTILKTNSLQKSQENINLLVTAVMNLFDQGKINMEYLKVKTEVKKTQPNNLKSNANNTSDSSCVSSMQQTAKNSNKNQKNELYNLLEEPDKKINLYKKFAKNYCES